MKLSRTRSFKVNLGNYESEEFSHTVSVEGLDLFDEDELADMDADTLYKALSAFIEEKLEQTLRPALARAAELSQAQSTILKPDEQPARRERTSRRSNR